MGNNIAHDAKDQVEELTKLRESTLARADADTPEVKKSLAAIDRVLGELGAPRQEGQQIVEKTRDVGGVTKTTTRDKQFAPMEQTSTKTSEPVTTVGDKKFTETSSSPVETKTSQNDKLKTVTTPLS